MLYFAAMSSGGFIDLYCERTSAGFWDEPVNALTNAAFLIAAAAALPTALRRPRRDPLELTLIALAGFVGVGSFLFHTLASRAAELADVIPIWCFVALFVWTVIYRMTQHNSARTLRIAIIAAAVTGGTIWLTGRDITTDIGDSPAILNGSLQYLPAALALAAFAVLTQRLRHP